MSRPSTPDPVWMPGELYWYTPDEGGRAVPPNGPLYCPTARFADQPLEGMFSVGIRLTPPPERNGVADRPHQPVELALMFPDRLPEVAARLNNGATLVIHEGRRAVAECVVLAPAAAPQPVGQ